MNPGAAYLEEVRKRLIRPGFPLRKRRPIEVTGHMITELVFDHHNRHPLSLLHLLNHKTREPDYPCRTRVPNDR